MKKFTVLLLTTLAVLPIRISSKTDSTNVTEQVVDCDLTCFEWMNGHWSSIVSSDSLLESWQISLSEETYGRLSRIVGSDTIKLEDRFFQWKEGEMFLTITTADSSSTATLKLVNTRKMTFVFINSDIGFPAKISFECISSDTLRTTKEGFINGKKQFFEHIFVRPHVWKKQDQDSTTTTTN